jgi:glycogen synthase kinase 3 beta
MNKNYDMKEYSKFPVVKPVDWKNILHTKDPTLVDLVNKIMQYSPSKRLTASEAMMHEYFDDLRNENNYK